jgi:GNAT superfamily N-acetyltransferase
VSDTLSYAIEPLGKHHDRAAFSCGVEALDRYLKQAGQESRRHVANCFVAVQRSSNAAAGYYTLSATSIIFESLPENFRKKLPRYPAVPAAVLGRLAVDLEHRGKGLGERLLLDAMRRTLHSGLAAAVLVADVKDEQAASFCYQYGFLDIGSGRTRLYLPVVKIAKLEFNE